MSKRNNGFTIVEILVTLLVIGILAAITVVASTRIQQSARDAERSSKSQIIADSLEKYYVRSGEYPSCSAMTQSGSVVARDVLKGLDSQVLLVPKSPAGTTNSIGCTALTSGSSDSYAYVGDGSTTCATGTSCLQFTFQYREEATGNIISIPSRHQTSVLIAGAPTLTGQVISNTQINISWTAISNTQSYKLQRATDSNFTTSLVEANLAGLSSSATGLAVGTAYYFRVAAVASSGQGNWSNVVNVATTISPPTTTPTMSANVSGSNAIGTVTAVSCPSGTPQYQIRSRTTATGTMGAWSGWSTWASTLTLSVPISQGFQTGFQAEARCFGNTNGSASSAQSNIPTTIRSINTPATPTYLSPSQFWSNVYAIVNYASYCPSGTSLANGTFRTRAWTGGTWGPNPFGYNDSWENYDGVDRNIEYWGKYRCTTSYATSPYSAESYNVIVVHP